MAKGKTFEDLKVGDQVSVVETDVIGDTLGLNRPGVVLQHPADVPIDTEDDLFLFLVRFEDAGREELLLEEAWYGHSDVFQDANVNPATEGKFYLIF